METNCEVLLYESIVILCWDAVCYNMGRWIVVKSVSTLHLIVELRIHAQTGMKPCGFLVDVFWACDLSHWFDFFQDWCLRSTWQWSRKENQVWGAYASGIHFEDTRKHTKGKMRNLVRIKSP